MKNRISSTFFRSLSLAGLAVCAFVASAPAQVINDANFGAKTLDTQAPQWAKLKQVNSAAKACHVVWHSVRHIKAQPDTDPEEIAQSMMKSARERGETEQKVLKSGEVGRKLGAEWQEDKVIESIFDFVRIGNSVLCNAVYPAPEDSQRFIEFYDGIYSLHAINEFRGEIRRPYGDLTRAPKEILYMSAPLPQVARFLLAIPLNQEFSPDNPALSQQNATLHRLSSEEWSVARNDHVSEGESQDPDTLIFGGDGTYLSSYEQLYIKSLVMDKDHKITQINYESLHKIVATEFKQYADGIWFPSKIVETSPNDTTEYTLIEANFNENVDPFGLTLPPDLRVADSRFGTGRNMVIYKTTDGRLLTDEEVKMKMAGR